jgi:hypothetical protein
MKFRNVSTFLFLVLGHKDLWKLYYLYTPLIQEFQCIFHTNKSPLHRNVKLFWTTVINWCFLKA